MKKSKPKKIKSSNEDMLPEYDFSDGVRGKYYKKYRDGFTTIVMSSRSKHKIRRTNSLVVLEPDIALKFKNSKDVNNALRIVIAAKSK